MPGAACAQAGAEAGLPAVPPAGRAHPVPLSPGPGDTVVLGGPPWGPQQHLRGSPGVEETRRRPPALRTCSQVLAFTTPECFRVT